MSGKIYITTSIFLFVFLFNGVGNADVPFRSVKIECHKDEIKVIDYSEWNDTGQERLKEPDVIAVDNLSTWKQTADGMYNVPDKPLPFKKICGVGLRTYQIVVTNRPNDDYTTPYPVVDIIDVTDRKKPVHLFKNEEDDLHFMPDGETMYLVSKDKPGGVFIRDGQVVPKP